MHPILRSKFLQLEDDLNKLFRDMAEISEEKLFQKPNDGGWSVAEVIQHLIVVEEKSLGYVKKKASYTETFKKAGLGNGARKAALKFFLYSPLKFKAPKVVDESHFDPDADMEDLMEKWRKVRLEMMNFLEEIPEEYLDKLIFRHAIAGRMTLDAMLLFIRDHFRRHRKQIDRVVKQLQ